MIHQKRKLWKQYINTKDTSVFNNYKIIRNQVRKHVRDVYRNEQNIIAKTCKVNPKKFWNYIKSKTKIHNSVPDLVYNNSSGTEITADTDEDKATVLCDFFTSIFCLNLCMLQIVHIQ